MTARYQPASFPNNEREAYQQANHKKNKREIADEQVIGYSPSSSSVMIRFRPCMSSTGAKTAPASPKMHWQSLERVRPKSVNLRLN
jgi:hypothetical protein